MLCSFRHLIRPVTFSVQRSLRLSVVSSKKRKTQEERKAPNIIQYSPKSKFKQGSVVEVWKNITVKELATQLNREPDHLFEIMEFVDNSVQYTRPGSVIDNFKVVEDIVKKLGMRFKLIGKPSTSEIQNDPEIKDVIRRDRSKCPPEQLKNRPPVVTIMGHVDHGKTTLLDRLRKSNIVESEFGGITQHIGAFSVVVSDKGERVTFLDTPGHAAFWAMRSRGARCTDIVVLVVAADDGVMRQTAESIETSTEAGVPIIVAINKIDKPDADVKKTRKSLIIDGGLQLEEEGGDVQVVEVSALKGTNIKEGLVDAILTQAELMELKADYSGLAEGVIIEATVDPHRGRLCTLLVEWGTLKRGAVLVAGTAFCKVRAMFDDNGTPITHIGATPSTPVQTFGWRGGDLPAPGDVAIEVESEKRANEIVEWRRAQKLLQKQEEDQKIIEKKQEEHYKLYREQLEAKRKLGRMRVKPSGPRQKEISGRDESKPMLSIIIKADVEGSVEAILDVLDSYDKHDECALDIVHYGVGPVSINDVSLAKSFSATVFTFNTGVLPDAKAEAIKANEGGPPVKIKNHNVIYKLVDDLKSQIDELLPLREVEEVIGEADVLQPFLINEGKSKVNVAGCRCCKGVLKKSAKYRLIRRGDIIFDGDAVSLRHLKNEVESIKKDVECGIRLEDSSLAFNPGDTLQCYVINSVARHIKWDPGF